MSDTIRCKKCGNWISREWGHVPGFLCVPKNTTPDAYAKARVFFPDGEVLSFKSQALAFSFWIQLPKGTRAAFRGEGDKTPVQPHDYVDSVED